MLECLACSSCAHPPRHAECLCLPPNLHLSLTRSHTAVPGASGLYQAGPRNSLFAARSLSCWVANACYQAAIMFAMVIKATPAIYADRRSGMTYTHWEVGAPSKLPCALPLLTHSEVHSLSTNPSSLCMVSRFLPETACSP